MDEINRKRLEWVAQAEIGAQDWGGDLFVTNGNPAAGWGEAMREAAKAALDAIPRWRPIAEAPVLSADAVKEYWTFPCLIQTEKGIVGEGFARWVEDGRMKGRRETCTLRWYLGAADRGRDTRVCHDPKYFMPLPAKRED